MSQTDKVCMELAFNQKISYSQRLKVKDFWAFFDAEKPLKPYRVSSATKQLEGTSDEQTSSIRRTVWQDQFKVFQEFRLDQAALAATEICNLCSTETTGSSELTDMVKEPYEQLLKDMKQFDDKMQAKTKTSPPMKPKMPRKREKRGTRAGR